MGADIHLWVERFDSKTKKWVVMRKWPCEYCDGEGQIDKWEDGKPVPGEKRPCYGCDGKKTSSRFWSQRSYYTFSILADVRNGSGFAGVRTGDGFVPIADPRGVPSDSSEDYLGEVTKWGFDGHSHSWLTLKEILDYNWDQVTTLHGTVDSTTYLKWRVGGRTGFPEGYSGGVWGKNVKNVSNEEMDKLIDEGKATSDHYTQVSWKVTYHECARGFLSRLELIKKKRIKPENIRLVFFFDN
jgi:hypothetical protein